MPRVKIDYVVSFSSEDPENEANNLLAWDVGKSMWLCSKGEPSCSVVLQLTRAVKAELPWCDGVMVGDVLLYSCSTSPTITPLQPPKMTSTSFVETSGSTSSSGPRQLSPENLNITTLSCCIESITIGTYHTALLEVLVGLSEKPDAPFEALVARCAVLSPREARAGPGPRVRSFTRDALVPAAAERRWDRLRVVCSQPYDRHSKYGLSFVHLFEPETPRPSAPAAMSQRLLRLDALSEDEEEFTPGELFAKHSQELKEKTSIDAQIRQATSLALKNVSDSSTKLMKTPISKPNNKDHNRKNTGCSNREKSSLLYTDDDKRPHAKIDHVVQRHKDQKQKQETSTNISKDDTSDKESSNSKKQSKEIHTREIKTPAPKHKMPHKKDISTPTPASGSNKKRKRSEDDDERVPGPVRPAASILSGVVFSLSGYVNPERASLRAAAVGMGAQYRADWGPDCTHLICAFPSTPRLRALRSRSSGALVPAATGAWLTACERAGRRLPWRAFATEPHLREKLADEGDRRTISDDPDGDTDDEIEKVLRRTKKKRATAPMTTTMTNDDSDERRLPRRHRSPQPGGDSPPLGRADTSNDSDVTFVRDERVLGSVTVDSDDDTTDAYDDVTDDERYEQATEEIDKKKSLPLTLDGVSVSVYGLCPRARSVVSRYVTAYGGLAVDTETGISPASVASLWRKHKDH